MDKTQLPTTVAETQHLIDELIDFAEKELDRDKRRELLLMSIELKQHLIKLKQTPKESI